MTQDLGTLEQSGQSVIAAAEMVYPHGCVDQDHRVGLRRLGVATKSGSLPPRRAKRLALSLSTNAPSAWRLAWPAGRTSATMCRRSGDGVIWVGAAVVAVVGRSVQRITLDRRPGAAPSLALVHAPVIAALPLVATRMERHQYSSQSFLALDVARRVRFKAVLHDSSGSSSRAGRGEADRSRR